MMFEGLAKILQLLKRLRRIVVVAAHLVNGRGPTRLVWTPVQPRLRLGRAVYNAQALSLTAKGPCKHCLNWKPIDLENIDGEHED